MKAGVLLVSPAEYSVKYFRVWKFFEAAEKARAQTFELVASGGWVTHYPPPVRLHTTRWRQGPRRRLSGKGKKKPAKRTRGDAGRCPAAVNWGSGGVSADVCSDIPFLGPEGAFLAPVSGPTPRAALVPLPIIQPPLPPGAVIFGGVERRPLAAVVITAHVCAKCPYTAVADTGANLSVGGPTFGGPRQPQRRPGYPPRQSPPRWGGRCAPWEPHLSGSVGTVSTTESLHPKACSNSPIAQGSGPSRGPSPLSRAPFNPVCVRGP
ncbi:hypothetical protein GWK47_029682 [Chionoecetes opilio]|uniref:Uncharacterized protein n=1 Tax=Chionoecetes opilio TaxID=41210 RepID=A0A8J4YM67_CHIOP|nr:hypothetical protein GWK47_029682 [Chionoecetes opilio]